jgi:hypothetical protein
MPYPLAASLLAMNGRLDVDAETRAVARELRATIASLADSSDFDEETEFRRALDRLPREGEASAETTPKATAFDDFFGLTAVNAENPARTMHRMLIESWMGLRASSATKHTQSVAHARAHLEGLCAALEMLAE